VSPAKERRRDSPASDVRHRRCPGCEDSGRSVSSETVHAMLGTTPTQSGDDPVSWHVCLSHTCRVAYYATERSISIDEVLEIVPHKKGSADPKICFCFEYRISHLVRSVTGDTSMHPIVQEIRARCREGLGRCETKNPEGRCCLGNITELLRDPPPADAP
jgi:hypothetical protein